MENADYIGVIAFISGGRRMKTDEKRAIMNNSETREYQMQLYKILKELNKVARKNDLCYYLAYGTLLGAVRDDGFIPWDRDIDILVPMDQYEKFCSILKREVGEQFVIYSPKTDNKYTSLFTRIGFANIPHGVMHVDIFPLCGAPKSEIGKKLFLKMLYLNSRIFYMKKISIKERFGRKITKLLATILKIILFPIPSQICPFLYYKLGTHFPISEAETVYNISGIYGYKEFIPKSWFEETIYTKFEDEIFPVPYEWHEYLEHFYGNYMIPKRENYV